MPSSQGDQFHKRTLGQLTFEKLILDGNPCSIPPGMSLCAQCPKVYNIYCEMPPTPTFGIGCKLTNLLPHLSLTLSISKGKNMNVL